MRIGLGYDIHRFGKGRRLVLGGIEFPGETGLDGHSDADVVLHAVSDAILGAAALGDIGDHFPPDDDRWKDADSGVLLETVVAMVDARYSISNVDVTIIAEQPKIGPRRAEMRQRLATLLSVQLDQVSIKATTNERLGAVGRNEGIAAMASVLLEERR
jgi:2-C-methyl-D-erythritol 2,4-cyclodiphosphate synthase